MVKNRLILPATVFIKLNFKALQVIRVFIFSSSRQFQFKTVLVLDSLDRHLLYFIIYNLFCCFVFNVHLNVSPFMINMSEFILYLMHEKWAGNNPYNVLNIRLVTILIHGHEQLRQAIYLQQGAISSNSRPNIMQKATNTIWCNHRMTVRRLLLYG